MPGADPTSLVPPEGTDWCRLYYVIKTQWQRFKGLRNRERIWTDIEEIFRRIAVYRNEGVQLRADQKHVPIGYIKKILEAGIGCPAKMDDLRLLSE